MNLSKFPYYAVLLDENGQKIGTILVQRADMHLDTSYGGFRQMTISIDGVEVTPAQEAKLGCGPLVPVPKEDKDCVCGGHTLGYPHGPLHDSWCSWSKV